MATTATADSQRTAASRMKLNVISVDAGAGSALMRGEKGNVRVSCSMAGLDDFPALVDLIGAAPDLLAEAKHAQTVKREMQVWLEALTALRAGGRTIPVSTVWQRVNQLVAAMPNGTAVAKAER